MKIHPNVVPISEMMTRLRKLPPIPTASATTLRRCLWYVEAKKGYATRAHWTRDNAKKVEATITSAGAFYVDVHCDGPTYCIAKGQDSANDPCGAASLAIEIVWAMRDGRPVPEHVARFMLPTEEAAA